MIMVKVASVMMETLDIRTYLGQEHSLVGKILEHVGAKNYILGF